MLNYTQSSNSAAISAEQPGYWIMIRAILAVPGFGFERDDDDELALCGPNSARPLAVI
jgi:hypothetical protein